MNDTLDDHEPYLATAAEMLIAEGMSEAAEVVRKAVPRVVETGFDNWNGGTRIWTIYLLLAPAVYARLGSKREVLEAQINERLKPILEQFTSDWYSANDRAVG